MGVATLARPAGRPSSQKILGKIALWASVFVIVMPAISVFLWMLSLSLKTDIENLTYPPIFIPRNPTLNNFAEVFRQSPFEQYTINSLIVSVVSTVIALVIGVPGAYGIAKTKAQGLAFLILIARMTPGLSYLIPWFMLFRFVGLNNTYWALIITPLVIGLPIVIWVMLGFFEDLHPEIEEAAFVDGCNSWQTFVNISAPLARPGMVVSATLAFIFSWNNFLFAVVLAGKDLRTLPVAVFNVLTFEQIAWGPLAAAALLVTLPVLILTVIFQRQIVAGLTAGGMKG